MSDETFSRRRSRWIWVLLAAVLVAAGSGLALWAFTRGPDLAKYNALLAQVASRQLEPDDRGRVDLARSFPGLTPHDEMFVERRTDGSFVALLPTYYPKGIAVVGLLYSSRPMTREDTSFKQTGTTLDRRTIDVGIWHHLDIDKRVNEQWYEVSRGMH